MRRFAFFLAPLVVALPACHAEQASQPKSQSRADIIA